MIKTPLSTVIGGVGMYTKNSLIIGGKTEPPFDIASLFKNGEQGFWLDPSDLSTMFQDAVGTIPVTGVGQPVGLMLDKSRGMSLGSDLANINNWIPRANTKLEIIGTRLRISPVSTGPWGVDLNIGNQAILGKWYKIRFVLSTSIQGRRMYVRHAQSSAAMYAAGEYRTIEQWKNTAGTVSVADIVATVGEYVELEVQVAELPGNHAYQTTSASRPILQNNIKFDCIDDALNIAFPSSLTNCTIFSVKHGQQAQILDAQSVAQNHVINQDFKYYGIVNRALTSVERAGLTRFLNKLGAQ